METRTTLEALLEAHGFQDVKWGLQPAKNILTYFRDWLVGEREQFKNTDPLDVGYYEHLSNMQQLGEAIGTLEEMVKDYESKLEAQRAKGPIPVVKYAEVPRHKVEQVGDRLREYGLYAGRILSGAEKPTEGELADATPVSFAIAQVRSGAWEDDGDITYFLQAVYEWDQVEAAVREINRAL